jgi:ABC-2 type transport system permease protein
MRAELRRTWILYVRYPMDYVSGLLIMLVTFYVIVMGARYISGPMAMFGDRLDSLILGYWLWNIAIISFSYTATALSLDAAVGTLEQIFLSPFGPVRVFLVRSIASIGLNMLTSAIMLTLMLLLTGRRLTLTPVLLVPLFTVLVTTYGIGLLVSGLTLLAKQLNQFLAILQFLFLPLVLVPFETWEGPARIGGLLLPVAPCAALLRGIMTRGESPSMIAIGIAAANAIVYFALGVWLFGVADRQARLRGLLGQH